MAVFLNEPALDALLFRPTGPVGRHITIRAAGVEQVARENASGPVIGIRSEDLLNSLTRRNIEFDAAGMYITVGANARHRGFPYPTWVHKGGDEPGWWLIEALRRVFTEGAL